MSRAFCLPQKWGRAAPETLRARQAQASALLEAGEPKPALALVQAALVDAANLLPSDALRIKLRLNEAESAPRYYAQLAQGIEHLRNRSPDKAFAARASSCGCISHAIWAASIEVVTPYGSMALLTALPSVSSGLSLRMSTPLCLPLELPDMSVPSNDQIVSYLTT